MATLNLGRIKPVFRGAYAGGTAYVIDDIVTSGNETFICIQASTGNATSNASYWTKLAAKGTDGTDVGTTLTTQGDILYRDGSGLQRLAKGTAGQVLKINTGATAPEWGTDSGGKIGAVGYKILTDTHTMSAATNTWHNVTGFNVTITPTTAGSSILVSGHISTGSAQGGPAGTGFKLYRSVNSGTLTAMDSFVGDTASNRFRVMVAGRSGYYTWVQENGAFTILDTSSTGLSYSVGNTVQYQMYWYASGGNACHINRSDRDQDGTDDVRSTSSITAMEVKA